MERETSALAARRSREEEGKRLPGGDAKGDTPDGIGRLVEAAGGHSAAEGGRARPTARCYRRGLEEAVDYSGGL
jgi:hypothetical protein